MLVPPYPRLATDPSLGVHRAKLYGLCEKKNGIAPTDRHKVGREKRNSLPLAFIKVQDASRLGCETWVAGKDATNLGAGGPPFPPATSFKQRPSPVSFLISPHALRIVCATCSRSPAGCPSAWQ